MNYKEQIKSPKWQKRRLEILEKDNFACQLCGDTETMLNVHHLCYHKDRNIWDYEDWELMTLCEDCHKEEHSSMDDLISEIESLKSSGLTMREITAILNSIEVDLYLGRDRTINNFVGDSSAMGREDDIKLLAERRETLKKDFHTRQKEKMEKESENNPF